jgi:hypothetical protein
MRNDKTSPADHAAGHNALDQAGFAEYTGSVPFDSLEFPNEPDNPDLAWAVNDTEVRRLYYGKVVAVHNRTVWGVGKNFTAAWEDARQKPGCPSAHELVYVVV